MRALLLPVTAASLCLLLAQPALANGSTKLPDPSGITLFALGLAGLIAGRSMARKDPDD